jgi:hypothetical protein
MTNFFQFDAEDEALVQGYNWTTNTDGYVVTYKRGTPLFLHTLLLGEIGVDHINGDLLDNRRSNLRIATAAQNMQNRKKWGKAGNRPHASKYKGVSFTHSMKKYQAIIRKDGKLKYLGSFDTEEEAAKVWDENARILHGEFARLNFPREEERGAL